MSEPSRQFPLFSRLLHWTMAAMVLAMLGIGLAMVVSLADYYRLVSIHRPLGFAILILVVVRFLNRLWNPPPPLPDSMPRLERFAMASEYTLYGLMFALPLVGWAMLSAADYPIVLYGSVHLPYTLPHNAAVYAVLRKAHTVLAYFFLFMILAHFGAVLFHTWIVRDGLLMQMAPWNRRSHKLEVYAEPRRLLLPQGPGYASLVRSTYCDGIGWGRATAMPGREPIPK